MEKIIYDCIKVSRLPLALQDGRRLYLSYPDIPGNSQTFSPFFLVVS